MIRVSSLINRPVICVNVRTGFLQNVVLDETQRNVKLLIVARGIRGKCIVPVHAITAITDEFILVKNTLKFSRRDECDAPGFVRDTDGLLIGKVTDYALDESTFQISAIEMIRGYWPTEHKERIWLFAYNVNDSNNDELVTPLISPAESMNQKGESVCVCPQ